MELTIKLITGMYLAVMAVIDRREKAIPIGPGVAGVLVIVLAQVVNHADWRQWIPGVLVGLFLYLTSKATGGAVGEGDALVYCLTGVALGFFQNLGLLVISLFFASLAAGFLVLFRHVGRAHKIPFVPFTALAYGVVMLL